AVTHGVGPGRGRVEALGADRQGERAARIPARGEPLDRGGEVVARLPAELFTRARVVVHALKAVEHRPRALRVDVLVAGDDAPHDRGRVGAQLGAVNMGEGRRRADDVTPEADLRRTLERDAVRAHDIFDVHAPVQ